MKRRLEELQLDTNALFGQTEGIPKSPLAVEEAKVFSLYSNEYEWLSKFAFQKQDVKKVVLETAQSALEAVSMLKKRNLNDSTSSSSQTGNEDAPEIVAALPDADGSRKMSDAQSVLKEARDRMAPIDPSSAMVLRHGSSSSSSSATGHFGEVRAAWHAPWKLMRVISGHNGWVRCCAVDVSNEWFATGSADRCIKIWDLASGELKLTLTGHIGAVRALSISARHPYLVSCGDDKLVKVWDLERNQVIRHMHGHMQGVYSCSLHPSLDVLVTGGRDKCVRVWDLRTRQQLHAMEGHSDAVMSLQTQRSDPQIISGSADSTVRLWDLAAGRCVTTLTHHKKGVRAVALSMIDHSFASASADSIKRFRLPDGAYVLNAADGPEGTIVNSLATNADGVLVAGLDDGRLNMWDYKTGQRFQSLKSIVQPGSLEAEACILSTTFDQSGSRLITTEADKTIKIWKEDPKAVQPK